MEEAMQSFTAEKILAVWEAGQQQHELDRALTLLATGAQGLSRDELADLTIGERDARLLQLRTLVLGPSATGFAECPQCGERVEFPIDTAALAQPTELATAPHQIEVDGKRVRFRLPTSRDLAEVVAAPDASQGLRRLIERCVIEESSTNKLPNETIEALNRAMLEADPQAEIIVTFSCPGCGRRWEMLFDIAHFFWDEIAAQARRLLREIDALARAYGWSEREILGLSTRRRQSYLELATA
jgi:predicted RNA-binding Zn-ribbon protein involved in translation (DUF1610 family)